MQISFYGNNFIKNTGVVFGYNPVLMKGAEVPVPESAGAAYFFKIPVELIYPVGISPTQQYRAFHQ